MGCWMGDKFFLASGKKAIEIVSFPQFLNGGSFRSYVNVYQRVASGAFFENSPKFSTRNWLGKIDPS